MQTAISGDEKMREKIVPKKKLRIDIKKEKSDNRGQRTKTLVTIAPEHKTAKKMEATKSKTLAAGGVHAYVDGSVKGGATGVGACFVSKGQKFCQGWSLQIPKKSHEAELLALSLSMDVIASMGDKGKLTRAKIFSDSQQALQVLQNHQNKKREAKGRSKGKGGRTNPSDPDVAMALAKIQMLISRGVDLELIWIPGHKRIIYNELADRTARYAADLKLEKSVVQYLNHKVPISRIHRLHSDVKWQGDYKMLKQGKSVNPMSPKLHTYGFNCTQSCFKGCLSWSLRGFPRIARHYRCTWSTKILGCIAHTYNVPFMYGALCCFDLVT